MYIYEVCSTGLTRRKYYYLTYKISWQILTNDKQSLESQLASGA